MSLVVHADLQGRVSRRCLEYIRLSDLSAVPAISSCISPCVPAQLCMSHRHHLLGSQEGHSRAGHPAAGRQPTPGPFCPSGTEGAAGKTFSRSRCSWGPCHQTLYSHQDRGDRHLQRS